MKQVQKKIAMTNSTCIIARPSIPALIWPPETVQRAARAACTNTSKRISRPIKTVLLSLLDNGSHANTQQARARTAMVATSMSHGGTPVSQCIAH